MMCTSRIWKTSLLCAAIMLAPYGLMAFGLPGFHLKSSLIKAQPQENKAEASDSTNVVERVPLTQGPANRNVVTEVSIKAYTAESFYMDFTVVPSTGQWFIKEKMSNSKGGETWSSGAKGFGRITYQIDDKTFDADLTSCEVTKYNNGLKLTFHPIPNIEDMDLIILATPLDNQPAINFSIYPAHQLDIVSIQIFENAFQLTSEDAEAGILVPVREGMLVPADSGNAFERDFGDSAYEGCHLHLWGMFKNNTAAFITWDDPYTTFKLKSSIDRNGKQTLSTTLSQKKKPQGFTFYVCGKGGVNEMAGVYKNLVATKKGYYVPWSKKLAEDNGRKKLFGATNFKLWSLLDRRMDEASQKQLSVTTNWTFEEAGKVAEHLKNDLKMDDVLFTMGGWIHRGYDNQHPDVLPAAPECGGNWGLRKAVWAIQNQDYVACLHDNYQDMYKDAPSWDEKYLSKNADGSARKGGVWAGGRAYLTCSKEQVKLASRPQNLPKILDISQARAYFIDTTYASGLVDCFDKIHPINYYSDINYRCQLSDYARGLFGIFGSEDGREWAIPHADFFEGIVGVSGNEYHTFKLEDFGAVSVPFFELVYHDCIAAYGKYGYDINQSTPNILRHISLGRTLYHHNVPPHLYWENYTASGEQNTDPKAVFVRSNQGWAANMHPFDVFVKNTHEILSPLNKLTAEMTMTRFDFMTPDKSVTTSVFQSHNKTVLATVNYGSNPYHAVSITGNDYEIPKYGFLIESESFIAFNATLYNGVQYDEPVLFTLRSLDGKPVWASQQVQVYHGFGPTDLKMGNFIGQIAQEATINTANQTKEKKAEKTTNVEKTETTKEEPAVIAPTVETEKQSS